MNIKQGVTVFLSGVALFVGLMGGATCEDNTTTPNPSTHDPDPTTTTYDPSTTHDPDPTTTTYDPSTTHDPDPTSTTNDPDPTTTTSSSLSSSSTTTSSSSSTTSTSSTTIDCADGKTGDVKFMYDREDIQDVTPSTNLTIDALDIGDSTYGANYAGFQYEGSYAVSMSNNNLAKLNLSDSRITTLEMPGSMLGVDLSNSEVGLIVPNTTLINPNFENTIFLNTPTTTFDVVRNTGADGIASMVGADISQLNNLNLNIGNTFFDPVPIDYLWYGTTAGTTTIRTGLNHVSIDTVIFLNNGPDLATDNEHSPYDHVLDQYDGGNSSTYVFVCEGATGAGACDAHLIEVRGTKESPLLVDTTALNGRDVGMRSLPDSFFNQSGFELKNVRNLLQSDYDKAVSKGGIPLTGTIPVADPVKDYNTISEAYDHLRNSETIPFADNIRMPYLHDTGSEWTIEYEYYDMNDFGGQSFEALQEIAKKHNCDVQNGLLVLADSHATATNVSSFFMAKKAHVHTA